jgi:putative ABC transport system ATP-binding protein
LSDSQRTALRREAVGFVFQRFNLLPTLSIRKNVELPLRIRSQANDGQVEPLLKRVGLAAHAHKKPSRLSVGQQQRVAIARAVVTRPPILLADEPTGNLDSKNAASVLELLEELHRDQRQTIVMITHNEQLTVHADRVLHMHDGRFVEAPQPA